MAVSDSCGVRHTDVEAAVLEVAKVRITDGGTARHPLVIELVNSLPSNSSEPWDTNVDLIRFWQCVEAAGTPLLSEGDNDGVTATFVWRDSGGQSDVDMVFVDLELWQSPLALLAGTDVWYVDVQLPPDYSSGYSINLGAQGKIVTEDVHEPWAASYDDPLNQWPIRAEDSNYPRNVVRASGLPQHEQLRGDMSRISVPALLLNGPRPAKAFPVSVYKPPSSVTSSKAPLPVVIFFNGQFVESSDALPLLERAMADGRLAPALFVIPGSLRSDDDHTAWGWRNGYGPHNLSDHLTQELLPALEAEHDLSGGIHLVAWGYASHAAVRTAIGCARVVSLTLLNPAAVIDERRPGASLSLLPQWPNLEGFDRIAEDLVPLMRSNCFVQLSEFPTEDGDPSASDTSTRLAGRVAAETGRTIARIPLNNSDMVAGASALLLALDRAFLER